MQNEPTDNLINRTFTSPMLMVIGFLLMEDFVTLTINSFGSLVPFAKPEGEFAHWMGLIASTCHRLLLGMVGVLVLMRIGLFFPCAFFKSFGRWDSKAGLLIFIGAAFVAQTGFSYFWLGLAGYGLPLALMSLVADFSIGVHEEIWFRGVAFLILLRAWGLERNAVLAAVLVSSLLFGLWHLNNLFYGQGLWVTLMQVLYTSFLGIIFAVLFLVNGTIWSPIIAHGFFDIGIHISNMGSHEADTSLAEQVAFSEAFQAYGGFVALSAVLAILALRYLSSQEQAIRERFDLW